MKMLILLTMLISLFSCEDKTVKADALTTKQGKRTIAVETSVIRSQTFVAYEEFFGKIFAAEEMDMISDSGGLVNTIKVKSGDAVKKGQKLCNIDGDKSSTLYEMAKLSEKVAKDSWNRLKKHLKNGRSSRLNVDNAKLSYLKAKQDRINSERSYNQAFCIAPFDGVVTAVHMEKFQNLNPKNQTLSIANLASVKVQLQIPESSLAEIKQGSEAKIEIPKSNKIQQASISSLDQKIDYTSKKFKAEIGLPDNKNNLKPGMTVKVRVQSYNLPNQLVIPSNSIITLTDGLAVAIVDGNKSKSVRVKVKANNGKESLVVDGIKVGQELITKGQNQAIEGSPVKITNNSKTKGKS